MYDSAAQRSGDKLSASEPAAKFPPRSSVGFLWMLDGRYVKPIKVRVGLSDGTNTEVQADELKEGLEVIVGEQRQGVTDTKTTNPFAPQMMRGSRP
jgi:hypothetical protein